MTIAPAVMEAETGAAADATEPEPTAKTAVRIAMVREKCAVPAVPDPAGETVQLAQEAEIAIVQAAAATEDRKEAVLPAAETDGDNDTDTRYRLPGTPLFQTNGTLKKECLQR